MSENVMLAQNYTGKDFGEDTLISRKFDGKRVIAIKEGGVVRMYSRAMKPQYEAPVAHILKELSEVMDESVVYDGELVYIDENGKEDFQKGISLAQSRDRKEGCDNLKYLIFGRTTRTIFKDALCQWDWNEGKPDTETFINVYCSILNYFKLQEANPENGYYKTQYNHLLIVGQWSHDVLPLLQDEAKEQGWEGLMLRNGKAPNYEFRRSPNLLKMKTMKDKEFPIVGMKEGKGKYKGTLGAITIRLDENNTVDVGSGFTDEQRDTLWNSILSTDIVMKVKYFEETTDRKGNKSLRFPVFVGLRDKESLEEIMI